MMTSRRLLLLPLLLLLQVILSCLPSTVADAAVDLPMPGNGHIGMRYIRRNVHIPDASRVDEEFHPSDGLEQARADALDARARQSSSDVGKVARQRRGGEPQANSLTRHQMKNKRLEPIETEHEHKKRWWFDDALIRHSDQAEDLRKETVTRMKADRKKIAEKGKAEVKIPVPSYSDDKEVTVFKR